ncbi:phenylalanine--tRNA ligase subunit beta [Fangia hongkongensis]|uniref:phenylalanine--tRNA ligase subunit beta n=1 Tax=Fangia hongkongensis TaxID=270495 RepID=UPI0019083730|nr:phenylalanine--tRNA ligase subunit beta [Fangia hongkongensis]MBK2123886.1 phenylalanine--tRNA ligase subunit beta [Fangia hongkongensis]
MKFSQLWLNQYLEHQFDADELSEKLTAAGLEVDAVEPVSASFTKVVIGEIQSMIKHPDADKLNVCQVDIGTEIVTIVCGAPNVFVGMKAPTALIGAVLPGDFKIKKSKLRGQESFGMLCSEKELGISDESNGLMILPNDAPVGQDIRAYLQLNDVSIEVDLTPNRADCLSVYGIAREVAALSDSHCKTFEFKTVHPQIKDKKEIQIKAQNACPIYYGRVIKNVDTKAQTPIWMKERLRRSGLRSISVIVDITNYILLEIGKPMHAFDFDVLDGDIQVRMANENEKLTLLDENQVVLKKDTLVIADDKKALAMAGIMGGLESSVQSGKTTNIFLESAFFTPSDIAGKARGYGLHTDSSHRYERGVDPKLAEKAIEYATQLILEIAGGSVGPVSACKLWSEKATEITLTLEKTNRLLGIKVDEAFIENVLMRLNMRFNRLNDGAWQVSAPSYRFDMAIEEDLIEEVGRVYGYQNIPFTLPKLQSVKKEVSEKKLIKHTLKSVLVNRGYYESINYSFIDPKLDEIFFDVAGISLQNPISQDLSVMRQSLIPGILLSFKNNLNRQQSRVRLFEEGVCFYEHNDSSIKDSPFNEIAKIAGLAYGPLTTPNWKEKSVSDFYYVKSDVEALLALTRKSYRFDVCDDLPWLHPGQSAYIYHQNKKIGVIGVLHPHILKQMNIKSKAPVVFELDLAEIENKDATQFEPVSKFPSVNRDIAFVVDRKISVDALVASVKASELSALKKVEVFDLYEGESIGHENKSIALNLTFQWLEKTLTDTEINAWMDTIIKQVKADVGGEIRS